MGVEKKMDLSNAGQLLVSMIKLVDSLVPSIVEDIDPEYSKRPALEQQAVEKRAKDIVTKVLTGLMAP